jgi:hypothetical protein
VLLILRVRFGDVPPALVARVAPERDGEVLDRWQGLAVIAPSLSAFERVLDGWRIPEVRGALERLIADGWFDGLSKGRAEGMAAAVLRILSHRFGELPPSLVDRVRREQDSTVLDRWLLLAIEVPSREAFERGLRAKRVSRRAAPR